MKARFFISLLLAVTLVWITCARTDSGARGQEPTPALPTVAAAPVPLYPPLARAVNAQGVVHIEVQTDGHKVIQAHAKQANKLLIGAAEDNAKNWQFSTHTPVTFTITYNYRLADECEQSYSYTPSTHGRRSLSAHIPLGLTIASGMSRLTTYRDLAHLEMERQIDHELNR